MMPVISGIIYTVLAALTAGVTVGYLYERKLYREAAEANRELSDSLDAMSAECTKLREELARLNGISQGRECDAMQREFLRSLSTNGQGTMKLARRKQDA